MLLRYGKVTTMVIRFRRLLIICDAYAELIIIFLIIIRQACGTSPVDEVLFSNNPSGNEPNFNPTPLAVLNDGRVNLILQAYLNKLSAEMQSDADMNFNPKQSEYVIHRLRGLYNHLKEHPALMDSRLAVGSRHPESVEKRDGTSGDGFMSSPRSDSTMGIIKRRLEMPLTEACPSVTEWISLNRSRDIHDQEVEIFQPNGSDEESQLGAQVGPEGQFFYTTRCVNGVEKEACVGTSFLYNSRCLTRKGYVMALVRKKPTDVFDWNWIQVAVSCNCGVSKKF